MGGLRVIAAFLFPMLCLAQASNSQRPLKIKIEATELDRRMLVDKLNSHGADHRLKFVLAEEDFDYRIVFGTGQSPVATTYGDMNASSATTSVFDSKGAELFEFKRAGRWTDSGATNAAAKEIIKRLVKLSLPTH